MKPNKRKPKKLSKVELDSLIRLNRELVANNRWKGAASVPNSNTKVSLTQATRARAIKAFHNKPRFSTVIVAFVKWLRGVFRV